MKHLKGVGSLPSKALGAFKRLPPAGKGIILAIPIGIAIYLFWFRNRASSAASSTLGTPPAAGGGPTFYDTTTVGKGKTITKTITHVIYRTKRGHKTTAQHEWHKLLDQAQNRLKRLLHYETEARKHHNRKWLKALERRVAAQRELIREIKSHLPHNRVPKPAPKHGGGGGGGSPHPHAAVLKHSSARHTNVHHHKR